MYVPISYVRRIIPATETAFMLPSVNPGTTFDPTFSTDNQIFTNGNLTVEEGPVDAWRNFRTVATISGKKYWSVRIDAFTFASAIGIQDSSVPTNNALAFTVGASVLASNLSTYFTNATDSGFSLGPSYGAGDRIDVAIDTGLPAIWFRLNGGNWNNSGAADPATGTGGWPTTGTSMTTLYAAVAHDVAKSTAQFASGSWTNPAPSGFTQIDA